jgi:REP element-mobilizing transposase RayT
MFKPNQSWDDRDFPLAFFVTLRTYGTWLHGNEKGSISRRRKKPFLTKFIDPNPRLEEKMDEELKHPQFRLDRTQRKAVEDIIRQLSSFRNYELYAVNVRTNHLHVVVSAATTGEKLVNQLKTRVTRELRDRGLIRPDTKVWSRGKSCRPLWKDRDVTNAIDYVLYGQGDVKIEWEP